MTNEKKVITQSSFTLELGLSACRDRSSGSVWVKEMIQRTVAV